MYNTMSEVELLALELHHKKELAHVQSELLTRHIDKLREEKQKELNSPPPVEVVETAFSLLRNRAKRKQELKLKQAQAHVIVRR